MDNIKTIDYVKSHRIGLDDSFSFACHQCGDCCKHRDDLILSGPDIYRIASALGIAAIDVIMQYCEIYIGHNSKIPVCHVKPIGKDNACPFLKDNRCAVLKSKPIVCALFPLGRAFDYDKKETLYFLQDIGGHRNDKTYTVREWLTENNVPLDDEADRLWSDMVLYSTMFMTENHGKLQPNKLDEIYRYMTLVLYGSYLPQIPLLDIMKANCCSLTDVLPRLLEK